MRALIDFCVNNWDILASIITAILAAVVGITKLTPTPKDDEIAKKVQAEWEKVSKRK